MKDELSENNSWRNQLLCTDFSPLEDEKNQTRSYVFRILFFGF